MTCITSAVYNVKNLGYKVKYLTVRRDPQTLAVVGLGSGEGVRDEQSSALSSFLFFEPEGPTRASPPSGWCPLYIAGAQWAVYYFLGNIVCRRFHRKLRFNSIFEIR